MLCTFLCSAIAGVTCLHNGPGAFQKYVCLIAARGEYHIHIYIYIHIYIWFLKKLYYRYGIDNGKAIVSK